MSVTVLALDLERTLIDDALSGQPRPGLREFLAFCGERFARVAIYTTVEEADAREVVADLAARGFVPPALFARLEFVGWCGEYKDLAFVPGASPAEVVLVDDDAGWVRPDQRGRWVPVAAWDGGPDAELHRVRAVLEQWLAGSAPDAEPV
ncbi:MAG TPA: NIF family HAD-type phosphatase [Gemmataceae bacterium]|nr:NIF family HAD-type phosphatase [Gemmataceae bacterium]